MNLPTADKQSRNELRQRGVPRNHPENRAHSNGGWDDDDEQRKQQNNSFMVNVTWLNRCSFDSNAMVPVPSQHTTLETYFGLRYEITRQRYSHVDVLNQESRGTKFVLRLK